LKDAPPILGEGAFEGVPLDSIRVQPCVATVYKQAAGWSSFADKIKIINNGATCYHWEYGAADAHYNPVYATLHINNGILTIEGSGNMKDNIADDVPWNFLRDTITTVVIDSGITSIGANAFNGCAKLHSVSIPQTVTDIKPNALTGCRSLTNINVNAANQYYTIADGILYNKAQNTIIKCPANKQTVTISPSVLYFADYAFADNRALNAVYNLRASLPQNISANVFDIIAIRSAYLYVDSAAFERFRVAPYWNNFHVEMIVPVTGVSINADSVSLAIDSTLQLIATIAPISATTLNLAWRSTNDFVAQVDSAGKITGKKQGTALIIVTTKDGSKTDTCVVTVYELDIEFPTAVAVDANNDLPLLAYPTVFSEQLTVDNRQWESGDKLEVYNLSGVLVYVSHTASRVSHINLSHLPTGTYIVKAGRRAAKVVKR
jgi:uncharacterized protein YjdB